MKNALEWVYGLHSARALIEQHPQRIIKVYCLDSRHDEKLKHLCALLDELGISYQACERKELDKLTQSTQHQGFALQCKAAQLLDKHALDALIKQAQHPLLLLVLDSVTDPHNLGACIRSAEAAGVDALIIPKNRSASLNATSRKVACGAAELLPIISVSNLNQCILALKKYNIWVFGAAGEASQSIYQQSLTGSIALVMGSEGDGLRQQTRQHCDALMHIPMHGATNSLNVSVATGICLFEAQRQRHS